MHGTEKAAIKTGFTIVTQHQIVIIRDKVFVVIIGQEARWATVAVTFIATHEGVHAFKSNGVIGIHKFKFICTLCFDEELPVNNFYRITG